MRARAEVVQTRVTVECWALKVVLLLLLLGLLVLVGLDSYLIVGTGQA